MPSVARRAIPHEKAPKRTRAHPPRVRELGRSVTPGPIVKWAGGKSRLIHELLARAPAEFDRYYEPFVGGGALFFRLQPHAAVLGDKNPDLIEMYRSVAGDVEAVLRRLRSHRQRHDAEYYYQMRERWNTGAFRAGADRAAAFIYLNKTCYNGLWRVNSRGLFNVPAGRYAAPTIYEPDALRAASRALAGADLTYGSFADSVASARKGDFVYFDPPYHPVTQTARFTSYTAGSFCDDDQRTLADVARDLANRGCHVMLSNSDTPFIRELYKDFRIDRVMCARAINSVGKKRGHVAEVIVTNR
jgi:DNA adenine methylase